jgi:hypothetical protein
MSRKTKYLRWFGARAASYFFVGVAALFGVACGEGNSSVASTVRQASISQHGQGHSTASGGERGRAIGWKLSGAPGSDRYVHIVSVVGYCGAGRKPRLRSVGISERRRAVVLTARVVPSRQGSGGCAPLGVILERTVRLRRPLGGRALFDGSTSPPRRRWPWRKSG